jgi:hypothetical protein
MKCSKCHYLNSTLIHTGDWFEEGYVYKLNCRRKGNKLIGYTETTYHPKVPMWCPLKIK